MEKDARNPLASAAIFAVLMFLLDSFILERQEGIIERALFSILGGALYGLSIWGYYRIFGKKDKSKR
jgi:hypothetical protein